MLTDHYGQLSVEVTFYIRMKQIVIFNVGGTSGARNGTCGGVSLRNFARTSPSATICENINAIYEIITNL